MPDALRLSVSSVNVVTGKDFHSASCFSFINTDGKALQIVCKEHLNIFAPIFWCDFLFFSHRAISFVNNLLFQGAVVSCVISSEPAAFINKMINLAGTKISERVPESIHWQRDFKSEADGIASLLDVLYVHQNKVKGVFSKAKFDNNCGDAD